MTGIAHISRRQLVPLAGLGGLAAWLAFSSGPGEQRIRAINEAFAVGKLGRLDPRQQEQLERLASWLVHHAGVAGAVVVNDGVAHGRLNIVVTTPELVALTHCGKGNAIYDPDLDTIFIDHSIVWPEEITLIGAKGAISMNSADQFGFVLSGLGFILAHELGHRQSGGRAAAFFALDWLRLGRDATEEEVAADRFAVRTITAAYGAGDAPELVAKLNALELAGLANAELSPEERAAGDIMGAMIGMTLVMQFTSSPYSPFFHDSAHPSFLERAADAISRVSGTAGARIMAQAPVINEQLARTRALERWAYEELHVPDPVARAEGRGDAVWLGTRGAYQVEAEAQPLERLFRLREAPPRSSLVQVAEGRSADDKLPGNWLDALLERGDPTLGLEPEAAPDIREERLFEPYTRWSPEGLAYADQGWFWTDAGVEHGIAVKDIERIAAQAFHDELRGGEGHCAGKD